MVPYNNVASDYLQARYYQGDVIRANVAMSIPDLLALLLIPFMGVYVDRMGRKLNLMIFGALCFVIGHLTLGMGAQRAVGGFALIFLGFAYSTLLAFWACVPKLVHYVRQATAYGILTGACNLSVTLISLIVAPLVAADPTFKITGLFFSFLATIALGLVVFLSSVNLHRGLGLNHNAQSDSIVTTTGSRRSNCHPSLVDYSA